MGKAKDIVSKTFGRLTVLEKLDEYSNDGYLHLCKCFCGAMCIVKQQNLTRGKTKSCGCLIEAKKKSLIQTKLQAHEGKRYGYLEVYDIIREESTRDYLAYCVCHGCNAIAILRERALKLYKNASCGCRKSESLSLSHGGTGIPYEAATLQSTIRGSAQNKACIIKALSKAEYVCALTKTSSSFLEAHHIVSLSKIIKTYGITKENWTEYTHVLFDDSNLIVLDRQIHQQFHKKYGYDSTKDQLLEFINNNNYSLELVPHGK